MSSTINASVDGIVLTASSTAAMNLATGGTNRLSIDTSGNVGIATGNLTFSSTAQRITGDMSNATQANRLAFQTSTTNGATDIYAIPNGTGSTGAFTAVNASDPNNASTAILGAFSDSVRLYSNKNGTGTFYPMTFYTGGSERMRLDTSGNLLVGTTSAISTSTARLQVAGSGVTAGLTLARTDAPTSGASFAAIDAWSSDGSAYVVGGTINFRAAENWTSTNHGTDIQFRATASGSGGALFEAMRITSAGNVGIGIASPGYKFDVVKGSVGDVARFTNGVDASLIVGAPTGGITYNQLNGGYQSWQIASSEKMRLDSSGNVGIGASSVLTGLQVSKGASEPSGELGTLLVTGSSTAYRLAMGYSSTNNAGWIQSVQNGVISTSLLLNPNGGNVGIGTASPQRRLSVVSTSGDSQFTVGNTAPSMSLTNDASSPNTASKTFVMALATTAGNYGLNDGEFLLGGVGNSRGNIVINANYSGTGTKDVILQPSSGNVGIGKTPVAGRILDTSTDAYFYGVRVGRGAGSVSNNTTVGVNALASNTTGSSNTAVGSGALFSNTTSNNNTAVGINALVFSTGNSNVGIGSAALFDNTSGSGNTGIGNYAGGGNRTGSNNTAVGNNAGSSFRFGSRNTAIGDGANPFDGTTEDETVVGQGLTGKGNNTAFIKGTNGAYNQKNVTTWETTSDARIKKNIADNHDGLHLIQQIRVRNFEYRKPNEITELPDCAAVEKDGVQLGVIAQEIQAVLPQCVTENSTGVLSVNTDPLMWHMVNAIKELSAQVSALQAELNILKRN